MRTNIGLAGPQASAAGTGRTERCEWRELGSPQGISGSRGERRSQRRGGGSARLLLSPGKTPARGGEAGQVAGTAGNGGNKDGPRPDAVMEKPIGAPRRGWQGRGGRGGAARASSLATLARQPGRGCCRTPPRSAPRGRRGGSRKQKMPVGEERPEGREPETPWLPVLSASLPARPQCTPRALHQEGRVAGLPHVGYTRRCTRPLGSCCSGWWRPIGGAHRPRQWRGRVCGGSQAPAHT